MKVTYGSLKKYVRGNLEIKEIRKSLLGTHALFLVDPLDIQTRFLTVDLFVLLGKKAELVDILMNSAQLAMESGHPAACMSFLHLLEEHGFTSSELWNMLADIYSKGSSRISSAGSRMAPWGEEKSVDGPEENEKSNDQLIQEILQIAKNKEYWTGFPQKLIPMPLFSDLDKESFLKASKGLVNHRLPSGNFIIKEGETGRSFYILALGALDVFKNDIQGREIHLANLHQGAIFGEMALVQRMPRGASVKTTEHSEILEFLAENLGQLAKHLPVVAEALDHFTRDRLLGNLLATSPLFKPFSKKQRKDLLRHFQAYVVETDTVVVREGEEGTGLYLVLSGEVEIMKNHSRLDETKLATLKTSDSFGEISLLRGEPTTATVVATTRSTLLFLSKHYFSRLINSVPQLKEYFYHLGENRLEATEAVMADNSDNDEEFILI